MHKPKQQVKDLPGYFVFHSPLPKEETNTERVKAELRLKFSHHLDRFFETLNRTKNDKRS